jgi:hypothetical protein
MPRRSFNGGHQTGTVTTQCHDPQTQVVADEPKAAACISALGWQKINN